jgi:hypothetical protein
LHLVASGPLLPLGQNRTGCFAYWIKERTPIDPLSLR